MEITDTIPGLLKQYVVEHAIRRHFLTIHWLQCVSKWLHLQMFLVEKTSEFDKWFRRLEDRKAKAKILLRLQRVEAGNLGDIGSVGDGIDELRIQFGPGYRIYYKKHGHRLILLLVGGDKSTQDRDIKKAKKLWYNYKDS